MKKMLPPLNAIRVFEAAARHLSFTKAAEELNVTQGAVSKQIKGLEDFLETPLFVRKNQSLVLTPQGKNYLPYITTALEALEAGTNAITYNQKRTSTLNISSLPSLSHRWLIPKIEAFKKKEPKIKVNILIGDGDIDFSSSTIDIGIRSSKEPLPSGDFLMGEVLVAIASPKLLTKPLKSAAEILNYPLLEHTTRPGLWREWLKANSVAGGSITSSMGFEHLFMIIQAAKDSLGLGLVPQFLVEQELKDGSCIIAFESNAYQSPYGYYLVYPKKKELPYKIRAFRKWVLSMGE